MQKLNGQEMVVASSEFGRDVLKGLQSYPKRLSSKYFYNKKGDKLFQEIMKLEEYYLTSCEYDILKNQKSAIFDLFGGNGQPFPLIELGAGDGLKTKILLKDFLDNNARFEYLCQTPNWPPPFLAHLIFA